MKLKISYRPQKSLWLKKTISKGLVIGILFNNIGYSFANTEILDGRYEAFEGNNITIDNVLEEDTVDIEIEGNTLVNLVNLNKYKKNGDINSVEINSNQITFTNPQSWSKAYYYFYLKPNTAYTVKIDANNSTDREVASYVRLINDINSKEAFSVARFPSGESGVKTKSFTTDNTGEVCFSLECGEATGFVVYKNIMLIEGDWNDKEIPEYFEGMKSVGELEDNTINLKIKNKNLFDENMDISIYVKDWTKEDNGFSIDASLNYLSDWFYIKVKPNTRYTIQADLDAWIRIYKGKVTGHGDGSTQLTFINKEYNKKSFISDGSGYITLRLTNETKLGQSYIKNIILYEGDSNLTYDLYRENVKELNIFNSLRALPDGTKDRIIKRNGQWVIERKCGEIKHEQLIQYDWRLSTRDDRDTDHFHVPIDNINGKIKQGINLISDTFINDYWASNLPYTICTSSMLQFQIGINMPKNLYTIDTFKQYIQSTPINIVYELEEPIYEPLNIDSTVNLYKEITHILNNSTIPANMKVTIDRTINRAVEAIELAKENPTISNISLARMWINLLKESIIKDDLHNQVNNIVDVDDLSIEKKKVSGNIDVYVKSDNMLSMSLSTNSITFDNFTGIDDMELDNALNITVNSSLPYRLNSYLLSDLQNADGSVTMNRDLLNIKMNNDIDYKVFTNLNEKVVLEDDCDAGNNNNHIIDFKLNGNNAHKADVYKAVIKFEAEQK